MNNEIFQKQYDFEIERKDKLSSSVNMPVVALTVLGSATASMLLKFEYSNNLLTYCFLLLLLPSIYFSSHALILVFRSLIGYSHHKISPSKILSKYYNDLIQYYISNDVEEVEAKSKADKDFNEYLNKKLSEASDANNQNNLQRGSYLHQANIMIAFSLLFIALSSPLYIYMNLTKTKTPYKIQIVDPMQTNLRNLKMTSPENNDSNKNDSTQSQPIEKPKEPENIVFRDNNATKQPSEKK